MRRLILISVWLLSLPLSHAKIRPDFWLDRCIEAAEEIVFVTASQKPGEFKVAESLRGSLKPGEVLYLEELVPPKNAKPLSEYTRRKYKIGEIEGSLPTRIPRQVEGARMLLFLKKDPKTGSWIGAHSWDLPRANTVWFLGWDPYVFTGQITTLHPLVLSRFYEVEGKGSARRIVTPSEADIRERINRANQKQKGPAPASPLATSH